MLKGWKTIGINAIIILAGVVAYLDANPQFTSILPPRFAWVPISIGVVNVILRLITTTAPFQKTPQ